MEHFSEIEDLAEKLRSHTVKTTRIEMAPWSKAYTVDINEIYTELTSEKNKTEPIGPEGKLVGNYMDLFETMNVENNLQQEETEAKYQTKRLQTNTSQKDVYELTNTGSTTKILIKADKGYGKTTIAKKIQLEWANKIFKTFSLVFLVFLKFMRQGDTIETVILQQTPILSNWNITESKLREILDFFGDRCLIIMDGSDEDQSIVETLVRRIGSRYNILLTYQFGLTNRIEGYFDTVARLEGLPERQAHAYFSSVLRDEVKVSAALKLAQTVHPVSKYYSPLLLLFTCILLDNNEIDLSKQDIEVGEIYFKLTRLIFIQNASKKKRVLGDNEYLEFLTSIGKVALQGLNRGSILFSSNDFIHALGSEVFHNGSYLATITKTFVHNVRICDGFLSLFPTGGDIGIGKIWFRLVSFQLELASWKL